VLGKIGNRKDMLMDLMWAKLASIDKSVRLRGAENTREEARGAAE
jgi:hypothetical protein